MYLQIRCTSFWYRMTVREINTHVLSKITQINDVQQQHKNTNKVQENSGNLTVFDQNFQFRLRGVSPLSIPPHAFASAARLRRAFLWRLFRPASRARQSDLFSVRKKKLVKGQNNYVRSRTYMRRTYAHQYTVS